LNEKLIFSTFVILRKITIILFLSIYLSSVTELHQLLKLPLLIEHFVEHKEKTQSLSFWEFLCMHYSQQTDGDGDTDRDKQLPFKSHDGCSSAFMSGFMNGASSQISPKTRILTACYYSEYADTFLSSAHLSSIWQPPKSC
jgi:hypothetical protein